MKNIEGIKFSLFLISSISNALETLWESLDAEEWNLPNGLLSVPTEDDASLLLNGTSIVAPFASLVLKSVYLAFDFWLLLSD